MKINDYHQGNKKPSNTVTSSYLALRRSQRIREKQNSLFNSNSSIVNTRKSSLRQSFETHNTFAIAVYSECVKPCYLRSEKKKLSKFIHHNQDKSLKRSLTQRNQTSNSSTNDSRFFQSALDLSSSSSSLNNLTLTGKSSTPIRKEPFLEKKIFINNFDKESDCKPTMATFTDEQFQKFISMIGEMKVSRNITNPSGSFAKCSNRFDGNKSQVESFVDTIKIYKNITNITDENALIGLPLLFEGQAAIWWQGVKSECQTFEAAMDLLLRTFSDHKPEFQIYQEIFRLKQFKDQKTDLFLCDIRRLFSKLPPEDLSTKVQLDIVYGQLILRLRSKIKREDLTSFDDLVRLARIEETFFEEVDKNNDPRNKLSDPSFIDSNNKLFCRYCKAKDHDITNCTKNKKNNASSENNNTSHTNTINKTSKTSDGEKLSIDIKCYGCGKSGFIKSNCPNCKTKKLTGVASLNVIEENLESNDNLGQNEETTEVIDFFSIMLEESYVQSRPLVSIDICGSHGLALIDTAAMISIASKSLFNVLRKNKIVFEHKNITIKLADGSVKTISVPMCQVPIILKQRSFATTIVALPDATHTLLGIDFLVKAGIVVDFYNRTWRFADSNIVFPLIHENKNINSSRSDMTNHSEIIKISSIEVLRSDEGTNLSTEERHRVEDMLAQNHITFAPGGAPTTYIEHHINTGTSRPISVPPYSMTPIKREILKGELNKMLDDDIIEECESPWSAPVVLVPKPNGSHRLCIDYRKLNAVTISDRYPMPKIDDLLHLAKRSLYMSTTDLRSGYWQVPVREEDRDKTAFISPFGLFRFKRMPFGLKNAPSTFQRLIDRLKNSLPDIVILAYLDDLIIISTSFEEHLADIERLFKQLNKYNLRANRDKCVFFRTSVKFLGHIIAENGIHPNPDKISAISKMIPPKNLSHLKTFLATCSWYRKFVPNFAERSSILSALTKKNAPWNWNLEHQTAFEVLKNALTTSPVLQQVDYGKPFILRTDASNYAVGAVLLQKTEDGDEKPIEYASRLLTQAERNYSTSEREALAVVWALKKYQGYLDGAEVTLGTDHQPLRWLMTLRSPSGRLARWALLIQSFNLNIEYIPGKANVVADYLSRPPTDDALEMYSFQVTMPINNISDIREKQLNDPDLKKIINCFEAIDHTDLRNWTDRGYLMNSGILYRYIPDQDNEEAQLVLPETMRGDILKAYHAEPTAGHYGVEKTYMKIANHYFWPGMRRNIENFIKNCLECQKYKPTNLKPAGLLRTPIMLQRMEKNIYRFDWAINKVYHWSSMGIGN